MFPLFVVYIVFSVFFSSENEKPAWNEVKSRCRIAKPSYFTKQ